jgi:hypothetical protein
VDTTNTAAVEKAMSMPAEDTLERETGKLWVTDAELIRRLGVPEKTARETLRMLDAKPSGFPKKEKLWGDRRYWPAVKAYFDKLHGVKVDAQQPQRGARYEAAR